MKHLFKAFFFILFLLHFFQSINAQNLSLDPTNIPSSSLTLPVTAYVAGASPINPLVGYTGQKIKYKWAFFGDNIVGTIYVKATEIPTGFSFKVVASSTVTPSCWSPGTASSELTLNTSYQTLVSSIWGTGSYWWSSPKVVSRTLTQNILITDFSQVRPGTYDIQVEYVLQ